MSSRDQPTPPFNSPYQNALRSTPLLHSPAYPSPARSDCEPSKYSADGLGLYNFSHPFPASGPPTSASLYPPSPQSTGAWSHLSTGTSPLLSEPIVDPWTSGAYDHPVTRSPLPWGTYQASHRSSLSSDTRELSIFSGDDSEHAFPHVKLEGGADWATEEETSPPGTVAPEQLTTAGVFPYDTSYASSMPTFGASHGESHRDSYVERPRSSQDHDLSATLRTRRRRTKIPPEEAKHKCDICGRGFPRSYNQKSHMATHDPNRPKDHKCNYKGCSMKFVRKTDLNRHFTSVHAKLREYHCKRCNESFARKDTLRRHQDDGCRKKNDASDPNVLSRIRSMRTAPGAQMPYYPSPVPMGYSPAEPGQEYASRSPPMFRDDSFGRSHL